MAMWIVLFVVTLLLQAGTIRLLMKQRAKRVFFKLLYEVM